MKVACLVPRSYYSARPKPFGPRGQSEDVCFPARSPRIRHRSELTERDWENAVQETRQESWLISLRWQLPRVRESKTVLDSGFHIVDSRFHKKDSGFLVSENRISDFNL